jgi:hypothetical protein
MFSLSYEALPRFMAFFRQTFALLRLVCCEISSKLTARLFPNLLTIAGDLMEVQADVPEPERCGPAVSPAARMQSDYLSSPTRKL